MESAGEPALQLLRRFCQYAESDSKIKGNWALVESLPSIFWRMLHPGCACISPSGKPFPSHGAGKLKALCQITESKDASLPSVLQNLSGKPALLGKSAKIHTGDGYIEIDIAGDSVNKCVATIAALN